MTTITYRDEAGIQWTVVEDFEPFFRASLEKAVESPDSLPDSSRLKASTVRQVYRVKGPGEQSVILKLHRLRSWGERLKYVVKKTRAHEEFVASGLLESMGIPVARALAYGERKIGPFLLDAFYLSEEVQGSEALGPYLEGRFQPGVASTLDPVALATPAVEIIAKIHRRGFVHRDYHGGNLLVRERANERLETVVIDLHSFRKSSLLGGGSRQRDLVDLLYSLRYSLDEDQRHRLAKTYFAAMSLADRDWPAFWASCQEALQAKARVRWRSRAKRCVKESSQFTRLKDGEFQGFRRRSVEPSRIRQWVQAHRRLCEQGGEGVITLGRRGRVSRVPDGGQTVVVKEVIQDRRPLSTRRSERAWRAAHQLISREIPTPLPLACVLSKDGEGYLVAEDAVDALSLDFQIYRWARDGDWQDAREVGEDLASLVVRMWRRGLVHRDLSAKNILVEKKGTHPRVQLVDTDAVRTKSRIGPSDLERALVQLGDLPSFVPTRLTRRFLVQLRRGMPGWDVKKILPGVSKGLEERRRHSG